MSGQCSSDETYTSVESESDGMKFNSSFQTRETSEMPQSRKLSLFSCSSSITIESPAQQYQKQIRIFGQYLITSSKKKRAKLQELMKIHYDQAKKSSYSAPIQFLYPITSSSQQSENKQNPSNQDYLYHFIGAWLISMGYKKKQNKKYVFSKFFHQFKDQPRSIAFCQQFYSTLGKNIMNEKDRINFMIKICKNGWEYFIQESGQFFRKQIQSNPIFLQFKLSIYKNFKQNDWLQL